MKPKKERATYDPCIDALVDICRQQSTRGRVERGTLATLTLSESVDNGKDIRRHSLNVILYGRARICREGLEFLCHRARWEMLMEHGIFTCS